jgi:hypothetical protein
MKNKESAQKNEIEKPKSEILSESTNCNGFSVRKQVKKVFYLSGLVGVGLLLKSCMPGYVGSEPSYVEGTRPSQPSSLHVWVDGDWSYNRQNRAYVHNNGYWSQPRQGHTYVTGHWQSGPKGHSWTKGRWQKEENRGNNGRR